MERGRASSYYATSHHIKVMTGWEYRARGFLQTQFLSSYSTLSLLCSSLPPPNQSKYLQTEIAQYVTCFIFLVSFGKHKYFAPHSHALIASRLLYESSHVNQHYQYNALSVFGFCRNNRNDAICSFVNPCALSSSQWHI